MSKRETVGDGLWVDLHGVVTLEKIRAALALHGLAIARAEDVAVLREADLWLDLTDGPMSSSEHGLWEVATARRAAKKARGE